MKIYNVIHLTPTRTTSVSTSSPLVEFRLWSDRNSVTVRSELNSNRTVARIWCDFDYNCGHNSIGFPSKFDCSSIERIASATQWIQEFGYSTHRLWQYVIRSLCILNYYVILQIGQRRTHWWGTCVYIYKRFCYAAWHSVRDSCTMDPCLPRLRSTFVLGIVDTRYNPAEN